MKKKLLFIVVGIVAFSAELFLNSSIIVNAEENHLTEVPEGYTGIYTKEDLNNIRYNLDNNYILMNDIVFTENDFSENGEYYNNGYFFTPIGEYYQDASFQYISNPFTGIFDGNNYVIENIKIGPFLNYSLNSSIGIFSYSTGTIKKLGVVNEQIVVSKYGSKIGGIVGLNEGIIESCFNSSNIFSSNGNIAGIAWDGIIKNSYNTGNITYEGTNYGEVAGIGGSIIENCHNTGSITTNNGNAAGITIRGSKIVNSYNSGKIQAGTLVTNCKSSSCYYAAGGLTAKSSSIDFIIENSYNTGEIIGESYGGGLVGYFDEPNRTKNSKISKSYNTGNVTSESIAGGIIGYSTELSINDCFNKGMVGLTSSNNNVQTAGGIVGSASSSVIITNCYNLGNISGKNSGGIVGESSAEISSSYNNGDITGSMYYGGVVGYNKKYGIVTDTYNSGSIGSSGGGVVGYNFQGIVNSSYSIKNGAIGRDYNGTIENVYYLKNFNDYTKGVGLNSEELKNKVYLIGFDFDNIWNYSSSIDYEYPVLRNISQLDDNQQELIPVTPVVLKKTNSSIILKRLDNYEYSIDGINFKDENEFTQLEPNTEYTLYQRIKHNSSSLPSSTTNIKVTTLKNENKNTPFDIVIKNVYSSEIELKSIEGYEFSIDGENFTINNRFTGLTSNTEYTVYQRIAETDTTYAGQIVSVKVKTLDKSTPKLLNANTVSFKDNLSLNFLAELDSDDLEGAYVIFKYNHYGEDKEIIVPINVNDKNGKYYRFRCSLTASEMMIPVTAELYLKDSTEPVSTFTRSIRDYIIAGLNNANASEAEKTLFRATLNYGGYTQKRFNYNGAPYAYDDYKDDVSNVNISSGVNFVRPEGYVEGIKYVGSSVFFRNAPYVRYYFELENNNIGDYTFKIGDTEITPTKKDGRYYIESSPSLAYQLDDRQRVVVKKNNTNVMGFDYSIIKWAQIADQNTTNDDERNMARAMYSYYLASKAYVESNS